MDLKTAKLFTAISLIILASSAGTALEELENGEIGEDIEYEIFILDVEPEFDTDTLDSYGLVEVEYDFDLVDGIAVEAPVDTANQLEELDLVENVREDRETFLPDPDFELPDLEDSEQDEETESSREEDTEATTAEGDSVSIAVLDTGVADDHQDFTGRIEFNVDFTDGDNDPYDYNGHGTHVASIALGDGDHPGVAPEATLQNIKVLGDDGNGRMSNVMAGVDHAVENNAEVIILSLGAEVENCNGRDMLSRTVDNAVGEGVAVVVASGNSGPEDRTVNAPGCSRNGFTVGAANKNLDGVARFSSRGTTSDNRIKPDITAPGTQILAADSQTTDGYKRISGTSMATPYVGGAIALHIDEDPADNPEEYFERLTGTATDLGYSENSQGAGLVDIEASLEGEAEQQEEEQEDETAEDPEEATESDELNETEQEQENESENGVPDEERVDSDNRSVSIFDRFLNWLGSIFNN